MKRLYGDYIPFIFLLATIKYEECEANRRVDVGTRRRTTYTAARLYYIPP